MSTRRKNDTDLKTQQIVLNELITSICATLTVIGRQDYRKPLPRGSILRLHRVYEDLHKVFFELMTSQAPNRPHAEIPFYPRISFKYVEPGTNAESTKELKDDVIGTVLDTNVGEEPCSKTKTKTKTNTKNRKNTSTQSQNPSDTPS